MKQSTEKLEKIRHSLSHLMAMAVLEKFPTAQLGIGPTIETGFYYDFLLPKPIEEKDLLEIENKIKALIKQNISFEQKFVSFKEAEKLFKSSNQPFKVELVKELEKTGSTEAGEKTRAKATEASLYYSNDFVDLCAGPHVASSKEISLDAFKLEKIAGAYWRGNEKNPMLQRIYGIAFETKDELSDYLTNQEEAKKRDHRKLGKELDLFTFSDLIGSGLPLYTPKGTFIRKSLNEFVEKLQSKAGYTQVWTPQLAKAELFKTSGHYNKYKDGMFRVVSNYSDEEFFLKPMNCPQHTQIYNSQMRSYRDLPLRYTDFAMLYRDEKPGELSGLARVRSFSQDDCHIFCREDQVDFEIDVALSMIKKIMATFGLKYRYRLSTRDKNHPEKYLGDPKTWDKVEKWAEEIMKRNDIEYFDGPGEAAFYAPKMDLMATDALGREWQLSTVQIDFVMPERFDLTYINKDGKTKRPVMLHRAIIGSPERFIMILLEHFAGALPFWISPTQIKILPVSEKHQKYADELKMKLLENDLRVETNNTNDTIGKRIRESEMEKIPYIIVVGDREIESGNLAVRERGKKDIENISFENFIKKCHDLLPK